MQYNTLKEKMRKGPVFGMTICSGSVAVVEMLGALGFDFVFIDAEHNPRGATDYAEMILAARLRGISPLMRVTKPDEVEIRKSLELGAEGVIVPHITTLEQMEICVRGAKFPPKGRRGLDFGVRSAGYGLDAYDTSYIDYSNDTELVIPMAEDFEFIDRIDELMGVPGIDAINFGPKDYALSMNSATGYDIDQDFVLDALAKIVERARPKGMGVMAPAFPPSYENAKFLVDRGVTMVLMASDYGIFGEEAKKIRKVIDKF